MFASQISSWYGGAINVSVGGSVNAGLANLPIQSPLVPHGIWTSADSDISVIAEGNINIQGSRIAAFDSGNIFVESLDGNVDTGTGSLAEILVNEVIVNPKTGAVSTPQQPIAGSGILATTLPDAPHSLAAGNITVLTPQGDIDTGRRRYQAGSLKTEMLPHANGHPDRWHRRFPWQRYPCRKYQRWRRLGGHRRQHGGQSHPATVKGLFISSGNSTIYGNTLNVTDLAGGIASVNAVGAITGIVIAGGGINVTGGHLRRASRWRRMFPAAALQSPPWRTPPPAPAPAARRAAAGEANSQKAETLNQPTSTDDDDEEEAGICGPSSCWPNTPAESPSCCRPSLNPYFRR